MAIYEPYRKKNTEFIKAINAKKVPCPKCQPENFENFFEESQGLENHFRVFHKGLFSDKTLEEARQLRRQNHFDNLCGYLDLIHSEAKHKETPEHLCAYKTQHQDFSKTIYGSSPEQAVKIFGLLLGAKGIVPNYIYAKEKKCIVTVSNDKCLMKYEIWMKQDDGYSRILPICTYVQRSDLHCTQNLSLEEESEVLQSNEQDTNDDHLQQILKTVFKLQSFRPQQRQVIESIINGDHVMTLMPTGGGKSLCFMLPAYVSEGLTVVIVPYNSLMYDIHRRLTQYDILSAHLNQFTPPKDIDNIIHDLNSPEPRHKVLITTPESLQRPIIKATLQDLQKRQLLCRFVIDEVHCMTEASHQFGPEYLKLGDLSTNYEGVQLVGLTATASPDTLDHIVTKLGIKENFKLFQAPVTRQNIDYRVTRKKKLEDIQDSTKRYIVENYPQSSGIVYCNTPEEVLKMAYVLENGDNKLSVAKYSGQGLDEHQKHQDMKDWLEGRKQVLVATKAAGTGIDKAHVRFVVHISMPDSIDEYYQQSGRCGRDGLPATAIMFYRSCDRGLHVKHISQNDNPVTRSQGIERLIAMEEFAYGLSCRKAIISDYFGESHGNIECQNMCDNCVSPPRCDDTDVSENAKIIINLILALGNKLGEKKVTPAIVASAYRGANSTSTRKSGVQECIHFGAGKGKYSDQAAKDLLRYLTVKSVLKEDVTEKQTGQHSGASYLTLGKNSEQALHNQLQLIFKKRKQ